MPIELFTDSATGYDLVTSFKDPADLTGKNDLLTLRRALLDGSIAAIGHILGDHNPADALSKPTWSRPKPNNALKVALHTSKLDTPTTFHTTTSAYRNSSRTY